MNENPDLNKQIVDTDDGGAPPQKLTRMRKGIYVVPSLITSAAFFCGFYAIVASINGDYYIASWAIVLGGFFDGMDGRVARLTGASTAFGVEYDSLSDLVTFGVAPAILMYNWVLQPFGKVGWMAAFLFALCSALRLAKFNTQTTEESAGDHFSGLPTPAAAGLLAATVLLTRGALEIEKAPAVLIMLTVYIVALLMVSNVPYRSIKNVQLAQNRSFHIILGVILFAFVIVQFPHYMLFAIGVTYLASGPVEFFLANRNRPWWEKMELLVGLRKE